MTVRILDCTHFLPPFANEKQQQLMMCLPPECGLPKASFAHLTFVGNATQATDSTTRQDSQPGPSIHFQHIKLTINNTTYLHSLTININIDYVIIPFSTHARSSHRACDFSLRRNRPCTFLERRSRYHDEGITFDQVNEAFPGGQV